MIDITTLMELYRLEAEHQLKSFQRYPPLEVTIKRDPQLGTIWVYVEDITSRVIAHHMMTEMDFMRMFFVSSALRERIGSTVEILTTMVKRKREELHNDGV